jgi:prepilin-type N-terminal cleavage/methylation domain-containing protein
VGQEPACLFGYLVNPNAGSCPSGNMNKRTSKRAFSLIELMVVLVIISILMGLMLSVIGRAREAARRTQCTANLKQIAVVLEKYRDDHGDYPREPLTELVRDKAILRCPSDQTKVEPGVDYTSYEYVLINPVPYVVQQAVDAGILVVCRHHRDPHKALIVHEAGSVKWETLPGFLVESGE